MAHPVRADGAADRAWWAAPPTRRVSHLPAVDPEVLRVALDPLPPAAPVVVHYRPTAVGSLGDLVADVLDQLDTAACAMFPGWLPDAARLETEGNLGAAAVRALAARAAARSPHFGPFLADLAERALHGPRQAAGRSRFAPGYAPPGSPG
ncbi:hypothetical protein AB0A95_04700 [Micromonospora sp. NPDC049230]|uniref:hypothetical protein n=1 Tax=Micromonospora sp. NPDC049230 TaxID=3155502 RepID=UPI0033ED471B